MRGSTCSAELKIGLREDDRPIIEEIRNTLKCGTIQHLSNQSARLKGGNGLDAMVFRIRAINETCQMLIPILDRYPLRTRKAHDYSKWREAALLINRGDHLAGGKHKLFALKQEMQANRKAQILAS
jgi:hypothetical protein